LTTPTGRYRRSHPRPTEKPVAVWRDSRRRSDRLPREGDGDESKVVSD
jgi:hypothetical protein